MNDLAASFQAAVIEVLYKKTIAAAREFGLSYSRFMDGLNRAEIEVDRKVLADLAVHDLAAFGVLAEKAKASLG